MSLKKYHTVRVHRQPCSRPNSIFVQNTRHLDNILTMPDRDPTQLILRPMPVQHDIERDQHPRQPRRLERQQAEEAEPDVRVPAAPDVHERRAQRRAEEGLVEQRSDEQERGGGVREQPGEVGDARGALLQHARVPLDEEDVEEEVEAEGAEVDEGAEEAPVLWV